MLDEEGCSHYYNCSIRSVPMTMPLQMVADFIVPKETSPILLELRALGCRMVPHKLHCYKETNLQSKFGYVTYFVHHTAEGSRDDAAIHQLCLRWLTEELPTQADVDVKIALAQPRNCCQAGPFLHHMHATCRLFRSGVQDVKKLETFVLGFVAFPELPAASCSEGNGVSSPLLRRREDAWGQVGTIIPESIPAIELGWLRRIHADFPEKADVASLQAYFKLQLEPLVGIASADSSPSTA